MTETEETREAPALQGYRELVARIIADYWAPLMPPRHDETAELPGDMEYGQADHILAGLVAAGVSLPGVPPDAFAALRGDDEPWPRDPPGNPAADDPMVKVSILIRRSQVDQLRDIATMLCRPPARTWQDLVRDLMDVPRDCEPPYNV